MKKPDAILMSDPHAREDQPICRTDDFGKAQWDKWDQIKLLQKKYNCPVLNAGDLFHHWFTSPELLTEITKHIPDKFFTIYGQHDLPYHNYDLRHKTGIKTLEQTGILKVLKASSWGQKPQVSMIIKGKKICVWHKFVWDGNKIPWPGCNELTARQVLKKYSKFDLIITGDHHKSFVKTIGDRMLVNPGCLTRQAADYEKHKPLVYLWYAKENIVELIYLKIKDNVITREHIEKQKQYDYRMEKFMSKLESDFLEMYLSPEEKLKRFLSKNKIKKSIVKLIYKAFEYEKII